MRPQRSPIPLALVTSYLRRFRESSAAPEGAGSAGGDRGGPSTAPVRDDDEAGVIAARRFARRRHRPPVETPLRTT